MGIDAEMFVRVPRKIDAETVHKTAVAMQIAFAGNDILDIRRPDPKAWMWKEGRQSLALVDVYEQDGPDIKPKRGESLVRVYLQSRFYGPGYERGDLIGILAVADYLKAAFAPCSVWYGGDSSGVLAQEIDQKYRAELWNHFCSSAARAVSLRSPMPLAIREPHCRPHDSAAGGVVNGSGSIRRCGSSHDPLPHLHRNPRLHALPLHFVSGPRLPPRLAHPADDVLVGCSGAEVCARGGLCGWGHESQPVRGACGVGDPRTPRPRARRTQRPLRPRRQQPDLPAPQAPQRRARLRIAPNHDPIRHQMNKLYTASRIRIWRQCHRAHYFRYTLGVQTPSGPAQQWGTYAHKALEAWYRAWMRGALDERLPDALAYIDSIEDISDVDRIRLRVVIVAYDSRWGSEDWEILGVEQQFRYFLGDVEIGGKLDVLIRQRGLDRKYVVEHKTSTQDTSPGSSYWERLTLDEQVSIYIDGASFGLDHEIAGCIYDVLKRPQHELLLATPEDKRKYTLGKGCAKCGGSAGGKKGIVKGTGFYSVAFASEVKQNECEGCKGTGWKTDEDGVPQAPRLHSNQRSEDETLDEYETRLVEEVAARVDEFLSRGVIVRLDSELPKMRQELLDTIASMELLDEKGLHSPNHDSCARGREMCAFFAVCAGRGSIEDFSRGDAHPELAAESAAEAA